MIASYIQEIATYLPKNVVTNEDLAAKFPEWDGDKIFDKIGINERRIASATETVADMATAAILNLQKKGVSLDTIDYLLVCTQSPDYKLPTTACIVQEQAGLKKNCAAIDINQGCSGFVYGLSLASSLIASENFKNVVLITVDMYSKLIHPKDKGNLSLFGDAATATLISTQGKYKIGKFTLGSDGSGFDKLILKNGGSKNATDNKIDNLDNFLYMDGGAIFDFTVKNIPSLVNENLKLNQLRKEKVDLYIFHQANAFMLSFLRKRTDIPAEKFLISMEKSGNTVSSSIPLAFTEYLEKSKYPKKIMFVGFGVGLSWGAVCLELKYFN